MKNILVATDFSKGNNKLLDHAIDQASNGDCKIWILFAAPPNPDFVGLEVGPKYIRDNVAAELREDHRMLQDFAANIKSKGINAEALMVQGPAHDVILYEANKLNADLIIMGSHGHGAVFDLLVGSVSKEVLKRAERPVLLVPTEKD